MGSPTSKAECDRQIASHLKSIESLKAQIAQSKWGISDAKSRKQFIAEYQGHIASHKQAIIDLKLRKKTLKS